MTIRSKKHRLSTIRRVSLPILVALAGIGGASAVSAQTQAWDLGVVNGTSTVNVTLNPSTWADYWFTTQGQRDISISTPGPRVAAALFDVNKRPQFVTSNGSGSSAEPPGRYFVRVFGNHDTRSGVPITIRADVSDTAGNDFRSARYLGSPGNPPTRVNENVGPQDHYDYYRLTIGSGLQINARVTPQAFVDLVLFGAGGNVLTRSSNGSLNYPNPGAGTYYVRAEIRYKNGSATNYTLDVGTVPQQRAPAPPRTVSRACQGSDSSNFRQAACPVFPERIGTRRQIEVSETIGPFDQDWFRVRVTCRSSQARLTALTSTPLNVTVFRFDSATPVTPTNGMPDWGIQANVDYHILITTPPGSVGTTSYTADFQTICN